jgi:4'-phosphopantetheinyl transferase EntD
MTKQRLQAEPAYENAHLVARDLLDRIGELLTDMPAPGDDEHPIDWGHVGSINHVNDLLSQVVRFITNSDEDPA